MPPSQTAPIPNARIPTERIEHIRFEKSIEIDAPPQRVWDVLSATESWPQRIETVDTVDLLTPAPISTGSRLRLKQPKLPEGTWDITVRMGRPYSSGGRSQPARPASPATASKRCNRYVALEAEGMKRAAESA